MSPEALLVFMVHSSDEEEDADDRQKPASCPSTTSASQPGRETRKRPLPRNPTATDIAQVPSQMSTKPATATTRASKKAPQIPVHPVGRDDARRTRGGRVPNRGESQPASKEDPAAAGADNLQAMDVNSGDEPPLSQPQLVTTSRHPRGTARLRAGAACPHAGYIVGEWAVVAGAPNNDSLLSHTLFTFTYLACIHFALMSLSTDSRPSCCDEGPKPDCIGGGGRGWEEGRGCSRGGACVTLGRKSRRDPVCAQGRNIGCRRLRRRWRLLLRPPCHCPQGVSSWG